MKEDQGVRWQKAHQVLRENALDIATMAACLGLEEPKLEAMLSNPPKKGISDALAEQIEQTFSKPAGWLSRGDDGGLVFDLFGA